MYFGTNGVIYSLLKKAIIYSFISLRTINLPATTLFVTKLFWPNGKRAPAGDSILGSIPFGHRG